MFRQPPHVRRPDTRIGGIFYWVCQDSLDFGRDRNPPVKFRPCLIHPRNGPTLTVLPSTTKNKKNCRAFFEIPKSEALFKRENGKTTFVYYRNEQVEYGALGNKLGLISHPLRLKIMEWIRNIYSATDSRGSMN